MPDDRAPVEGGKPGTPRALFAGFARPATGSAARAREGTGHA
jgi:hypothetical protein